ncbi:OmpA family protein [Pseudoroseicyclus sp. CXY001]|uniref:OmpA family protein n=1 Tax=Pseudoroseicyclus sp. CXY001 TaxID=3242492 RepID=UPI0035716E3D
MRRLISTTALLGLLAGCAPGPAGDVGFGVATANNLAVQTGEVAYLGDVNASFTASVTTTINFAFDSAVPDSAARAALNAQAAFIAQYPDLKFRVYGHTDLVGSEAYNYNLGLRRANAAVAYLTSRGISRGRLEAVVSYGETQPLIATTNPERANRRTVTEVSGFASGSGTVLNGEYAHVIYNDYVASAAAEPTVTGAGAAISGGGGGGGGGGGASGGGGDTGGGDS